MFYSKKSNNHWLLTSSAMVGGFLIGFSYKKYGKDIKHQLHRISNKFDYDDYSPSDESSI